MTTKIFEEWLTDLKQMMKKEHWKILLFADNITSHHGTMVMSNVTVEFLLSNLTSELQPLDQGIIRAVKAHYCKMLQCLVTITETSSTKSDFNKSISILHAIQWLSSA
jgi:hypothetical protein